MAFWLLNVRTEIQNICRIAFHNSVGDFVSKPRIKNYLGHQIYSHDLSPTTYLLRNILEHKFLGLNMRHGRGEERGSELLPSARRSRRPAGLSRLPKKLVPDKRPENIALRGTGDSCGILCSSRFEAHAVPLCAEAGPSGLQGAVRCWAAARSRLRTQRRSRPFLVENCKFSLGKMTTHF